MHDEFRIEVELPSERVGELLDALGQIQRDGGAQSPSHVAVTHEDGHVFLYTDSAEDSSRAQAALQGILSDKQIAAQVASRRWHPEEERWEDVADSMPHTPSEHAAEHQRLERLETEESEAAGHPQWEVRVTLPTHHDARDFAERLGQEGMPLRRHWRHLQLGTRDEDEAHALAERLRKEAPAGTEVEVEGGAWDAWVAVNSPARPFAIFGGLAQ